MISERAIAAAQSSTPCDHLFKLTTPAGSKPMRIQFTCIRCDIQIDADLVSNSCELACAYMQMGGKFHGMDFSSLTRKKKGNKE